MPPFCPSRQREGEWSSASAAEAEFQAAQNCRMRQHTSADRKSRIVKTKLKPQDAWSAATIAACCLCCQQRQSAASTAPRFVVRAATAASRCIACGGRRRLPWRHQPPRHGSFMPAAAAAWWTWYCAASSSCFSARLGVSCRCASGSPVSGLVSWPPSSHSAIAARCHWPEHIVYLSKGFEDTSGQRPVSGVTAESGQENEKRNPEDDRMVPA